MQFIHHSLFITHIVFGVMALILFWVPIVSKKGSINHKKFGRAYQYVMYTVASAGIIMALMVIYDPIALKGHLYNGTNLQGFVDGIRRFWIFFIYLGWINIACLRQGMMALSCKKDNAVLRRPISLCIQATLLIGGAVLIVFGAIYSQILQIMFGCLGIVLAIQNLRFAFAKQLSPKRYLHEHLAGFIGSGIGGYTAFLTFGGRQLLSDIGQWQLLFWVAPGIIGAFAISYFSRNYVCTLARDSKL